MSEAIIEYLETLADEMPDPALSDVPAMQDLLEELYG